MKYLTQFQRFDMDAFLKGKVLKVIGVGSNTDFETKQHLGSKIEVAIIKDDTTYKQKVGEQKTNLYEKFTIKFLKDIKVSVDDLVYPIDVVAKVYGPYNDQLSVTAGDLKIAQGGKF